MLLTMPFKQTALDANDQLLGTGTMMNLERCMGIENRPELRCGMHPLIAVLNHFLTTDGHLNKREGIEDARLDGDITAVGHATDTDAPQSAIVDAGIDRPLATHTAQAIRAENALPPLSGFFYVLSATYFESGQDCFGRRCCRKNQIFHCFYPPPNAVGRQLCYCKTNTLNCFFRLISGVQCGVLLLDRCAFSQGQFDVMKRQEACPESQAPRCF
ncbi:hypothetical protein D3C84_539410 [compost metagenome]